MDLESFLRGGPNSIMLFLVDKGMDDPNTAINGPSSAHQQNAIEMAFHWRADDRWHYIECWLGSFVIFQGIRTSIAKKPYIFVIFQGGPDPLSSPLDPPMSTRSAQII